MVGAGTGAGAGAGTGTGGGGGAASIMEAVRETAIGAEPPDVRSRSSFLAEGGQEFGCLL